MLFAEVMAVTPVILVRLRAIPVVRLLVAMVAIMVAIITLSRLLLNNDIDPKYALSTVTKNQRKQKVPCIQTLGAFLCAPGILLIWKYKSSINGIHYVEN